MDNTFQSLSLIAQVRSRHHRKDWVAAQEYLGPVGYHRLHLADYDGAANWGHSPTANLTVLRHAQQIFALSRRQVARIRHVDLVELSAKSRAVLGQLGNALQQLAYAFVGFIRPVAQLDLRLTISGLSRSHLVDPLGWLL